MLSIFLTILFEMDVGVESYNQSCRQKVLWRA